MILWNLRSAPELTGLSDEEIRRYGREAADDRSMMLRGVLKCMLVQGLCIFSCAGIGIAFSAGLYGTVIGCIVGGAVYAQMRLRDYAAWIKARHARLSAES